MGEKNYHLKKTLEDVPEEIEKEILDSINFFSRPNVASENINDEVKAEKLRKAFNLLTNFLVENKINNLNPNQKLFLNTGAIADKVFFEEIEIELLKTEIYEKLLKIIEDTSSLPPWTEQIYYVLDKFQALSIEKLQPLDLETPISKKKFRAKEMQDKEMLLKKKDRILWEIENLISILEPEFNNFLELAKKIDLAEDWLEDVKKREFSLSFDISDFFNKFEEVCSRLKKQVSELNPKISEIVKINLKLKELEEGSSEESSVPKETWIPIDRERLKNVKKDLKVTTEVMVKGCDRSENRIPYSASRILLNLHTEDQENPWDCYCTKENLMNSILKISKIHTNLFPKDNNGFPVLPPILIEPGRNYVEWFDDRFIVSFVSGEFPRKGPKYSFTPVDMQVLKLFGLYLTKDPIFDHRGERNLGTFMGDYAGKIEKKTKVMWVGKEKKFSLGTATEITDEASREEAIKEYMEFIFNIANEFPPPSKLGQRRIGVLLNYIIVESIENTIKLILKYIGFNSPLEARQIILNHANKSIKEARRLVEQAFSTDPQISKFYGNDLKFCLTTIFGKEL
jgi:hypothetical protein